MADSMCGPSNALQSFQKHSTSDRTLQQDRLTSRQSPAQGFRSSPAPNASLADREFESFQAGQLPLNHGFQPQHFSTPPPQTFSPRPTFQQAGPSNWASDFQRLNLSATLQPHSQQGPSTAFAQQRHDTGGWHQDFAQQQGQMGGMNMGQPVQRAGSAFGYTHMVGNMGSQYLGGFGNQQAGTSMSHAQQPVEAFDEEAFARAFDHAKEELESQVQVPEQEQNVEMALDTMVTDTIDEVLTPDPSLSAYEDSLVQQQPIGADTIHEPTSEAPDPYNDPDNLAKTASDLLNRLQHDQSIKFQNSQFLELMRQFRDGEATVDREANTVVSLVAGNENLMMSGGNQGEMHEPAYEEVGESIPIGVFREEYPNFPV